MFRTIASAGSSSGHSAVWPSWAGSCFASSGLSPLTSTPFSGSYPYHQLKQSPVLIGVRHPVKGPGDDTHIVAHLIMDRPVLFQGDADQMQLGLHLREADIEFIEPFIHPTQIVQRRRR